MSKVSIKSKLSAPDFSLVPSCCSNKSKQIEALARLPWIPLTAMPIKPRAKGSKKLMCFSAISPTKSQLNLCFPPLVDEFYLFVVLSFFPVIFCFVTFECKLIKTIESKQNQMGGKVIFKLRVAVLISFRVLRGWGPQSFPRLLF